MSYLCTNCVGKANLVLLSVTFFIQLFCLSVSTRIAFSRSRAQYIQTSTVVSALVRTTWYFILTLERINIRYYPIRRRYSDCLYCSSLARASPALFAALKRLTLAHCVHILTSVRGILQLSLGSAFFVHIQIARYGFDNRTNRSEHGY